MNLNTDGDNKLNYKISPPNIQEQNVPHLIQRLYGLKVISVKELNSYDDKNFFIQVMPEKENVYIQDISPTGYVLKILNSDNSLEKDIVEGQLELMSFISIPGVATPIPVKNIYGNLLSYESIGEQQEQNQSTSTVGQVGTVSRNHIVRLFIFAPGKLLKDVPYTKELLLEIGKLAANFGIAQKGFVNSAIINRNYRWNLTLTGDLYKFLFAVKDPQNRALIEDILSNWTSVFPPIFPSLEKGIIHSDLNEQNILVHSDNPSRICALLDFGDIIFSPLIFELAVAITYVLFEVNTMEINEAISHVVAGYAAHRAITENEWSILKESVAARCAQSLVYGAYAHCLNPSNDYVLYTAKKGWKRLRDLWLTPKDQIIASWKAKIVKIQN